MHAGDHDTLTEFLRRARRDGCALLAVAVVPTALYALLGWRWLAARWVPVALVCTAAACIVGFRNGASHGRARERRPA